MNYNTYNTVFKTTSAGVLAMCSIAALGVWTHGGWDAMSPLFDDVWIALSTLSLGA